MRTKKLLSRDDFRNGVFDRDNHICVVPNCGLPAVDAHHIIERKLWNDEGYYLDNGASLCEKHHRLAEANKILPLQIREWLGIKTPIYPPELIRTIPAELRNFTKWGFILIPPNREYPKYPTTFYLPNGPVPAEHTKDLGVVKNLVGVRCIVTTKMDGSNTRINNNNVTARNGISADHKSFDMLKAWHAKTKHKIPSKIDIFGEWLYAKHSIHYKGNIKLKSYFQAFAAYNTATKMWVSWDMLSTLCLIVGCNRVPILGVIEDDAKEWFIQNMVKEYAEKAIKEGHEGAVVRNVGSFHYSQFSENVMKYVRPNHVQTSVHWKDQIIVKNEVLKL